MVSRNPLKNKGDFLFEMKETFGQIRGMDHSQMVDTIDSGKEEIHPELVSKILEEIKASWLDITSKVPTASELEGLGSYLYDGFTIKQLRSYLESGNRPIDYLDLYLPYFSSQYKRSSWRAGKTTFPAHRSARQIALKAEFDALGKPHEAREGNKHELVRKILVQQWRLISWEEMNSSGELDIWISRQQLDLVLNHSKDIVAI